MQSWFQVLVIYVILEFFFYMYVFFLKIVLYFKIWCFYFFSYDRYLVNLVFGFKGEYKYYISIIYGKNFCDFLFFLYWDNYLIMNGM